MVGPHLAGLKYKDTNHIALNFGEEGIKWIY